MSIRFATSFNGLDDTDALVFSIRNNPKNITKIKKDINAPLKYLTYILTTQMRIVILRKSFEKFSIIHVQLFCYAYYD